MATDPVAGSARGKRVALVLGAGGARGLAHIGVIEVLLSRGYEISAVAGSSMGALVGGIHAAGEHRIENLPIPYVAVATDLATQREVWFQRGPLFDAIRASIAIPLVFTPHEVQGRELVDGGLLAPLPVAATRAFHCDAVIAVDLNARAPRSPVVAPLRLRESEMFNDDAPLALPGWRARMAAWFTPAPSSGGRPLPPAEPGGAQGGGIAGVLDLLSRSLDTMHSQITRLQLAQDPPDLLIRIPRDTATFYEFWRAKELREIGREAAEAALDAWH